VPALCITNTPTKARQKVVLVSPHFEPGAVHLWSRFGQEAPRRGEPAGGVPQRGGGGSPCPLAGQHSTHGTKYTAPSRPGATLVVNGGARPVGVTLSPGVVQIWPDGQHALTHPPFPTCSSVGRSADRRPPSRACGKGIRGDPVRSQE
jgi:hypothetical protein